MKPQEVVGNDQDSFFKLVLLGRASPKPAQLLAFASGKEQAAGLWEP